MRDTPVCFSWQPWRIIWGNQSAIIHKFLPINAHSKNKCGSYDDKKPSILSLVGACGTRGFVSIVSRRGILRVGVRCARLSLVAQRFCLLWVQYFHWNDAYHCVTSPQLRMKSQCHRFNLNLPLKLVIEVAVDRTSRHFQRIVYGKPKQEGSKKPLARIVWRVTIIWQSNLQASRAAKCYSSCF